MPQFTEMAVRKGLVTPDGSIHDQKGSKSGVAFADGVHGEYAAAAIAGRLFFAANQTAVTTSTTKNTTWTGLGIENPVGSSKLIILRAFSWAFTVAPAAGEEGALSLHLTTGTFSKAITPICCRANGGSSVAVVDTAATVIAGSIFPIAGLGDADTSVAMSTTGFQSLGGMLVLPPGHACLSDTTDAYTSDLIFGFLWEEVPA